MYSDYINANYLDTCVARRYISCQVYIENVIENF